MPFFHKDYDEFRVLNTAEKQILALTVCGSFFSFFDFTVYIYFKEAILASFFAPDLPDWLKSVGFMGIVASGYLFRPLGGIIMAKYGDLHGRKSMLMLGLVLLAFSSMTMLLLPSYYQIGIAAPILLIIIRAIQGFAFGGEVSASWVYLAEHLPRSHVGLAGGLLIGSSMLSTLCNGLFSNFLSSILTVAEMQSYGWRIPFLVGGLGTLMALYLRSKLTETRIWLQAYAQGKIRYAQPLTRVLSRYQYGVFTALILSWFTSSLFLIVVFIVPSIGAEYMDLDDRIINVAHSVGTFFGIIGTVFFGYLADRFNAGKVLFAGCIGFILTTLFFFTHLDSDSNFIYLAYAVYGFNFGLIGIIPSICVRLFPVEVRYSGVSFCYNIAYAFTGILTPLFLTWATDYVTLAPALYIVFICIVGAMVSIYLTNLQGLDRMEDNAMPLSTHS